MGFGPGMGPLRLPREQGHLSLCGAAQATCWRPRALERRIRQEVASVPSTWASETRTFAMVGSGELLNSSPWRDLGGCRGSGSPGIHPGPWATFHHCLGGTDFPLRVQV